jgi:hypothetical protein
VGYKVWKFDERWNGASIPQEHWHFHRQLLDRYGIIMGPGDFSDMLDGLRLGKALLVKSAARGRGIYRWRLKTSGRIIFVLANKRMVFTAWPPTAELRAIGATF